MISHPRMDKISYMYCYTVNSRYNVLFGTTEKKRYIKKKCSFWMKAYTLGLDSGMRKFPDWEIPDRENPWKFVFSREIQSGIPEFQIILICLKISKEIEWNCGFMSCMCVNFRWKITLQLADGNSKVSINSAVSLMKQLLKYSRHPFFVYYWSSLFIWCKNSLELIIW